MNYAEAAQFFKSAPLRCPACDLEWQDHAGIGPTCERLQQALEVLEEVLPFCRPPEGGGIEESIEYFRRMKQAKEVLSK